MAEKTVQTEAAAEKKYVSYCIPESFIDQKGTDALNKKHPDKERVVIHTRKDDRGINWEESLFLTAKGQKSGKPRLNPMTDEQKEKQGLDKDKNYYIVNFSEDHKDKLFINKRVGTDENGKGIYEKTTKDLNEKEFAAVMKKLEPWHRNKVQEAEKAPKEAEKAVEKAPAAKEAEKAPKTAEKTATKEAAKEKAPVKRTVKKEANKKEVATKKRGARQS